jgi:hypothetical protein
MLLCSFQIFAAVETTVMRSENTVRPLMPPPPKPLQLQKGSQSCEDQGELHSAICETSTSGRFPFALKVGK